MKKRESGMMRRTKMPGRSPLSPDPERAGLQPQVRQQQIKINRKPTEPPDVDRTGLLPELNKIGEANLDFPEPADRDLAG